MRAVCTDGTEIACANFTAVEGGVLLTSDKKRKTVFGFVPNANLAYVLPDDVEPVRPSSAPQRAEPTDDAAEDEGAGASVETIDVVEEGADDDADAGNVVDLDVTEEGDGADESDADEAGRAEDVTEGLVTGAPDATTVAPDEDLRRLAGLGDTYAARLHEAGVETVSDLRARSVDEVTAIARVPRGRAERWLRLVTPREDAADRPGRRGRVGRRDGRVRDGDAGVGMTTTSRRHAVDETASPGRLEDR